MAKKDDITLIIAKSLSRQYLEVEEIELCKSIKVSEFITDYGLTDYQAANIVKWCIINTSAIKSQGFKSMSCEEKDLYLKGLEKKENRLDESIFSNIKKLFGKNKKINFELEIKKQIEMCASNSMDSNSSSKKFKDPTQIGEFLQKANAFKNDLEHTRVFNKPKINSFVSDKTVAEKEKIYFKNLQLSSNYPEKFSENISVIMTRLESLENIMIPILKAMPSSAKNESRTITSKQKKNSEILAHGYMKIKNFSSIKKSLEDFINFIAKEMNLKNDQQKYLAAFYLKKYIGNLYYELYQILEEDSKSSDSSNNTVTN